MRKVGCLLLGWLLCACNVTPKVPPADLSPLTTMPAFAVVTSDYSSTAIAMLDEEGELITEAWIDSGTITPLLGATLDGNVVMPSFAVETQVLNLLNQLGATVITRIAIPSGEVISQFSAQRPEPENGSLTRFRANIQDMLDLHDGTVLVTRFEPNRREGAEFLDLGNDAVIIRLSDGVLLDRISFDPVNNTVDGVLYYARPTSMVPMGSRVLVATARLDQLFNSGEGSIAVLDPASRTTRALEVGGLADCLEAVAVPGDPTHAVVLCQGDTFTNMAGRRVKAGIVYVGLDVDGEPEVQSIWRAAEHESTPSPSNGLVSLGGTRVAVNAMGDRSDNSSDSYLTIDLADGSSDLVFSSTGAFVVSKGAYVPAREQLLVPDASNGVRIFSVSAGAINETGIVETSPYRHLPPREVRALVTE